MLVRESEREGRKKSVNADDTLIPRCVVSENLALGSPSDSSE